MAATLRVASRTEINAFRDASQRALIGVAELICKILGVSPSAYYERRSGRRSARAIEDERLLGLIETTHAKNYSAYGYRRTWKALVRAGEQVPRCTVQRLMRGAGIQGAKRAASLGARPRRIPALTPARTWSSATSARADRTSSGSPT